MHNAAKNAGLSAMKIAEALSVSDSQVRHYFKNRSDPTVKKLLQFAHLTGVSVSELLEPETDEQLKNQTIDFSKSDFINLPIIRNVKNDTIEEVSEFAFSIHWLRRLNVDPKNALLVQVFDNNMEPTYPEKSLVLVDTGSKSGPRKTPFALIFRDDKDPKSDPIYIKRIEWDYETGMTILHNDNPDIPTDFIKDIKKSNIEIIGKVVWAADIVG